MIRHKVKKLDLFIKLIDRRQIKYVAVDSYALLDPDVYRLVFSFDTRDGKVIVTAAYVNDEGDTYFSATNEDWSELCDTVRKWNKSCNVKFVDDEEFDDSNKVLFKDLLDWILGGILKLFKKEGE